jgi:hypothetical protein
MFEVLRELYKHFNGRCWKVIFNFITKRDLLEISSNNVVRTIHIFYLIPSVVQLLYYDLYVHPIYPKPSTNIPFPHSACIPYNLLPLVNVMSYSD